MLKITRLASALVLGTALLTTGQASAQPRNWRAHSTTPLGLPVVPLV